jgi:hypothetical protein
MAGHMGGMDPEVFDPFQHMDYHHQDNYPQDLLAVAETEAPTAEDQQKQAAAARQRRPPPGGKRIKPVIDVAPPGDDHGSAKLALIEGSEYRSWIKDSAPTLTVRGLREAPICFAGGPYKGASSLAQCIKAPTPLTGPWPKECMRLWHMVLDRKDERAPHRADGARAAAAGAAQDAFYNGQEQQDYPAAMDYQDYGGLGYDDPGRAGLLPEERDDVLDEDAANPFKRLAAARRAGSGRLHAEDEEEVDIEVERKARWRE